ncbi:TRAM domain-containing protein [Phytohabitans sp. ZYX-F-186]|uniref:TRAM domain-containing protein n=1 Tax=Phytohabitans maris TaxID=3071409 RepID=A0ABU0ZJE2_9ACTN|nr:TRAM domain-containing protein [Phytohabitans sp. ZYX-F-186]MDQ7906519.1 TRAM domain-containing protein [Phytohabitans sp. ZYX-F-186]
MILERVTLDVGPVAHGGHCVARVGEPPGRVVFVRHALPGERVVAEITEEHPGYLRADAVSVLTPSPDRVEPPCPYARPDACGGCDLQHVAPPAQLAWKAAVVREQLARLAGLPDLPVRVEPLSGGPLGWRTRVRYTVDAAGRTGLLKHRSHEVVPVDRCRIAHPAIQELPVTGRAWPSASTVDTVAPAVGPALVGPDGAFRSPIVERAVGREWTLPADAFWQVHPAAADALAGTVLDLLDPRPGESAWDLYGGAGLFAAALATKLGADAPITLVESAPQAVAAARTNLIDLTGLRVVRSTVEAALRRGRLTGPVDLVVLDPPRTGAGAAVTRAVMAAGPRAVAYVACDPAAFARDVRTFRDGGWRLAALRAFDLFPMTHHVECVGLLLP